MAVQFAPQSNKSSIGSEVGAGLSDLIASKVDKLKKAQGIKERESIYKAAKLPSWLARIEDPKEREMLHKEYDLTQAYKDESMGLPPWINDLPEQDRNKLIQEFQKLSPEDKDKISEALNNIGAEQFGADDSEDQRQEVLEEKQMGKDAYNQQAQMTEAPIEGQNVAGQYTPLEKNKSSISGLNGLMEAGNGFQRQPSDAQGNQAFLGQDRGTSGQASPGGQPYANGSGLNNSIVGLKKKDKTTPYQKETLDLAKEKIAQKERHFEKNFERDLEKEANKETKERRDSLFNKEKAADEILESVREFRKLEEEGLPGAGYLSLLKDVGLDLPALKGAPAEEYEKIAAGFVKHAKEQFPGRVTDNDLKIFLKQIPSLANSVEGRHRINAILERSANLDKAEFEAYREIVKENKGKIPFDLDIRLHDKMKSKRNAVYKQFREDINKPIPRGGEGKLSTAAWTAAGKIAPAATGALIGSFVPGVGTAAGAAAGHFGPKILKGVAGMFKHHSEEVE